MNRRQFLKDNMKFLLGAMLLPAAYPLIGRLSRPKAKSMVLLTMPGGPSQLELFNYRPELFLMAGKRAGESEIFVGPIEKFDFHGSTGRPVSRLLPYTAKIIDELALIHSLTNDVPEHVFGQAEMLTGTTQLGAPYVGAWLNYALKREFRGLPNAIVLPDPSGLPDLKELIWETGDLPNANSQIVIQDIEKYEDFLKTHISGGLTHEKRTLSMLKEMELPPELTDLALSRRTEMLELSFRVGSRLRELLAPRAYTREESELYGVKKYGENPYADRLIVARRLLEEEVPFIQIYSGPADRLLNWDNHRTMEHIRALAKKVDQPTHGFIQDLKNRNLLDQTVVVWAGEFGRTSYRESEKEQGRDHNNHANTIWLTGGGIRAGATVGETDELGDKSVSDLLNFGDVWTTVFHQMGIDATKLAHGTPGAERRLTKPHHQIIRKILG